MQAGIKAAFDCIKAFSETGFTEASSDVPTLIAHRDDDQIVPIGASAMLSAKLVPNATLKIYPGAPHGIAQTQPDVFNADLLAFIERERCARYCIRSTNRATPSRLRCRHRYFGSSFSSSSVMLRNNLPSGPMLNLLSGTATSRPPTPSTPPVCRIAWRPWPMPGVPVTSVTVAISSLLES
jgi:hypothetical protein